MEEQLTKILDKYQKNQTELQQQIIKQSDVLVTKENSIKKLQEQLDIEKCKTLSVSEMEKNMERQEVQHLKEKEELQSIYESQIKELKEKLDIEKRKVLSLDKMQKELRALGAKHLKEKKELETKVNH